MVRKAAVAAALLALAVAGALASMGGAQGPAQALPTVPAGFDLAVVASIPAARQLAVAPNGDLFVGTWGKSIYVVAHPEGDPAPPAVFASIGDAPVQSVAFGRATLYAGGQFGVWAVPYGDGDLRARGAAVKIAAVRTAGGQRDHLSTSLAFSGGRLYASVGSSCDACSPELDPTRATIQEIGPDGSAMHAKAVGVRNAVALGVDPGTGAVWAGVAGQDALPHGHPYEIFDAVTAHEGVADYGWPRCYDEHVPVTAGTDCSHQALPLAVFPAYATPIGIAFYPHATGRYAFGQHYEGGAFVTLHGSWHLPPVAPLVAFVPMTGGRPTTPLDWNDPAAQWRPFVDGFAKESGRRIGRPTGIAVGTEGSLFVADDTAGVIYRIRPRSVPTP
jgi:glucose/arabinose dehydrogenase